MPTIVDDIRAAEKLDPGRLRLAIERLNEQIRSSRADAHAQTPVRFAELARLILYVALEAAAEAPPETEEEDADDEAHPGWTSIRRAYETLREAVGGDVLPKTPNRQMLASFCSFRTRKTGTHKILLYAALAILTVHLHEQGALDTNFLNVARPLDERDLPQRVRAALADVLEPGRAAEPAQASAPQAQPAPAHPEVAISFAYEPGKLASFEDYRGLFATPHKGEAHFVTYRPSRTHPNQLVKSFLAIKAPDPQDPGVVRFVHVYRAPGSRATRLSLGRVLALEHGVYLVGGQREEHGPRQPFKSLKVIALPWYAINDQALELRALIMSANAKGYHLVSRAVLRPTPVWHSRDLTLGGVASELLSASLQEDLKRETAVVGQMAAEFASWAEDEPVAEWRKRFPLLQEKADLGQISRTLLQLCNNAPSGWEVGQPFGPVKGAREVLIRADVDAGLVHQFGSSEVPKYVRTDADGGRETFEFWQSLRFGPLTHD